ncbi:DUF1992 domain-containing protein [Sulfidibacter corallicola]|uniref:DUF1992 domain-containing protein n=1 Tax=Sulfidibacter corallicola TaxID=2818388 RepID=A0A8A4TXX9_SULCO|nr:DnaJ family domain-containing protein [Sulfidibacter corallicola]QTD51385.1 DUF1992 domain-containing protein [Sulfidibacter corallicola]
MHFLDRLVEERIRAAQRDGAFDNLPGKGKPLEFEDDSGVPEELRVAYKILKNAGCVPPEMALRKELVSLQALIETAEDERAALRYRRQLNLKRLQLETAMQRLGRNIPLDYLEAVQEKLN